MYKYWILLALIILAKNVYSQDYIVTKEKREFKAIRLKPVVQFSCAVIATPEEDVLEKELQVANDTIKLSALKTLITLNAPSSVKLQHKTFLELTEKYQNDEAIILAKKMFEAKYIENILSGEAPKDHYARDDKDFYWAIRAVGVMKLENMIPKLIELSETENLYTQLAAEKSIEDFDGKVAEDALIKVISFWKYNAYCHATSAMLKRDPTRLLAELEKMTPPEKHKYDYTTTLAKCGSKKSVPLFCDLVKNSPFVTDGMFYWISELGTIEHKKIIDALPDNVRPEHKEKALQCVEKFNEKLQKAASK